VKRNTRIALGHWLSQYKGHEVLAHETLDSLAVYGVRYSVIENRLYDGRQSVPADVMSADEMRARYGDACMGFAQGDWRGVRTLDLAQRLCQLVSLGDPARVLGGTLTRYRAYVNALLKEES